MAGAAGGFLTRALESMLKECSPKKYTDLHKAITIYLDSTRETNQRPSPGEKIQAVSSAGDGSSNDANGAEPVKDGNNTTEGADVNKPVGTGGTITIVLASAGHTLEENEVELVLQPLRLAFETKNLKLVEPALACLHKLIAYDHLEGDPGLDGGKNAPQFTDILNMVCGCVDNSSSDSTILQVLKVLLTAVASTKSRVHGEPLLGVIRVCYNSKSPINQATSKAMLTQMISIVFRRMETDQSAQDSPPPSGKHPHTEARSETIDDDGSNSKNEEITPEDQNNKGIVLADALSNASCFC